jgi:hypothetical protein
VPLRVILTAGFDRALHVVALAELLRRDGVIVVAVLVVSPYGWRRLRQTVRRRGWTFVWAAAARLTGASGLRGAPGADPVRDFLRANGIAERSLRRWAARHGARYLRVASLNEPRAVRPVRHARADGVVYGGGGILHEAFLEAAEGRVLNAHAGPLPFVRGMNACEWSLLLGHQPAVSIHFIDRGIDTGPLVEVIPVHREPGDTIESLRGKCTVQGIEGLRRHVHSLTRPIPRAHPDGARHRQCYVMADALRELLACRLRENTLRERGPRGEEEREGRAPVAGVP